MAYTIVMDFFEWTNTYLFDFYSPIHIVQICVMAGVLVAAGFLFYKRKNIQNMMYILLAVSTNTIVLVSLVYSFLTGTYHLEWYLPLHICNLFVIISVLSCIFKKKVRHFLNEYMIYCGFGGCLIGIIIPASTLYYFEAYSFISMIVWVYHLIIGVMSVYLVTSGAAKLKLYNCWKAFAILLPLAGCALVANYFLNTNFIGLNRFKPIFGLEQIANLVGKYYSLTLISIFVAAGVVVTAISLIMRAYKKKQARLRLLLHGAPQPKTPVLKTSV